MRCLRAPVTGSDATSVADLSGNLTGRARRLVRWRSEQEPFRREVSEDWAGLSAANCVRAGTAAAADANF